MVSFPVIQEACTTAMMIGDLICGDTKKAKERLDGYYKQSVVGSFAAGTLEKVRGNHEKAKKFYKGCRRATGQAICGGGFMENVPGFQELSTAGKSLGELFAGDTENIKKHVHDYIENSVIGSFVAACVEGVKGDYERRNELLNNSGKAAISAAVSGGATAVTALTGGAAAPLGVAASAAVGGAMGVATSVIAQGANDILYNDGKLASGGDYVGGALLGGTFGAISGAQMADAYQRQQTAKLDANRMRKHKDLLKGFKEKGHDKFTSATIHDNTDSKSSHGLNRALRNKFENDKDIFGKPLYKNPIEKIKQLAKKSEYANVEGSLSYPKGYHNVKKAFENPKVQAKLKRIGPERWEVQNCAEAHALETFKANNLNAIVDASYTLEVKNGHEYIKAPCNNCKAMGEVNAYGRVPFEKYDGMYVDDAIKKHVENANATTCRARRFSKLAHGQNVTKKVDSDDDEEMSMKTSMMMLKKKN